MQDFFAHFRLPGILLILCTLACGSPASPPNTAPSPDAAAVPEQPSTRATMGHVEALTEKLASLVSEDAGIEILAAGFDWSEGPLWVKEGGFLLFSDVPRDTIYRYRDGEGHSVWLESSGYTGEVPRGGEPGSNGLALDAEGALVLCQHGDRRVARLEAPWTSPQPNFTTLANQYNGKRFHSPNDLAIDSSGNVYFTDPPYGLEGGPDGPGRELDFQGVYRVTPEGQVSLLTGELSRPNGIALSPAETTLYVANSDPEHAVWMAYDLTPEGGLANGRILFNATSWVGEGRPGLPDGLKVDQHGNLFATGPGGVLIFSAEGAHLGTLRLPQPAANCAFGDDGSSLYITADSHLLRVRLNTRGLGFDAG